MTARICHNPRCSESRQTLRLLRDRGVEPEILAYLESPADAAELARLLDMPGLEPRWLMRRKEPGYDERGLDEAAPGRPRASVLAIL